MFKFITRRNFFINLLVAIVLFLLIIILVLWLLGYITNHGKYLSVPSVVSMKTADAKKLLESKGFEVVITDSVYVDSIPKGTVIKQIPEPYSTVKVNRSVLLIVNRVYPPLIDVPDLNGKTMNFAIELLRRSHFELGDTTFRTDFTKGSVLEQLYRGSLIAPGTKLPWGSKIDLVIGSGLLNDYVMVPDLTGKTFDSAKIILNQSGIILGAVLPDPDVLDTPSAFIYKQKPVPLDLLDKPVYMKPGQIMDLWLSKEFLIDSSKIIKIN